MVYFHFDVTVPVRTKRTKVYRCIISVNVLLLDVGLIVICSMAGILQTSQSADLETLLTMTWDSNAALAITSELILIEIVNRIFICIFEVCEFCYVAKSSHGLLI